MKPNSLNITIDASIGRILAFSGSLMLVCVYSGCRQRAYTELYVENMAGEIRMLEDRVYDFDAALQASESDLEEQRHLNSELERKLAEVKASNSPSVNSAPRRTHKDPPSIIVEPESYESVPSRTESGESFKLPSVLEPSPPPSIDSAPSVMRTPAKPTPEPESILPATPDRSNPTNAPLPAPGTRGDGSNSAPIEPRAQLRSNTKFNSNALSGVAPESLVEQVVMPDAMLRSAQQPKSLAPVPSPSTRSPGASSQSTPRPLLPKALQLIPTSDQGAIRKNQVVLPEGSGVQLASATLPIQEPPSVRKTDTQIDPRIIEIGFHRTLCRGQNLDERPGDDGVYLVLTPINRNGQVVNVPGKLTLVVKEGAVESSKESLFEKDYSASELTEYLTAEGTSQGFHLSIPWASKRPANSSVSVFVRYQLEDGRTLVNSKTIPLRNSQREHSTWTPRE
jgi:hypothetical protein